MSHASLLVVLDGSVDPNDKKAVVAAVTEAMAPFDENDGAIFADGSRWDWWQIGGRYAGRLNGGDIIRKRDYDQRRIWQDAVARSKQCYAAAIADKATQHRELLYGVKPDESEADFLSRTLGPPDDYHVRAYAVLWNKTWYETGRLGWFGMQTATECERAGADDTERCVHTNGEYRIVSYGETDEEARSTWNARFAKRFLNRIPDDAVLVMVDYHV